MSQFFSAKKILCYVLLLGWFFFFPVHVGYRSSLILRKKESKLCWNEFKTPDSEITVSILVFAYTFLKDKLLSYMDHFSFKKKILLVWNIFSLFQDKPLFLQYLLIGPPDAYWDYKRKETVKDGL